MMIDAVAEISTITQHCQDNQKERDIRLFSDGGYTLHERTDFEILGVTKRSLDAKCTNSRF